jgi:hypothetical protein
MRSGPSSTGCWTINSPVSARHRPTWRSFLHGDTTSSYKNHQRRRVDVPGFIGRLVAGGRDRGAPVRRGVYFAAGGDVNMIVSPFEHLTDAELEASIRRLVPMSRKEKARRRRNARLCRSPTRADDGERRRGTKDGRPVFKPECRDPRLRRRATLHSRTSFPRISDFCLPSAYQRGHGPQIFN